jgi:predicted  nucleic acid-binding Zn-ribbon protein
MKAAMISVGLLLTIVLVTFWEMGYVEGSLNTLISDVEQTVEAYNNQDFAAVKNKIDELEKTWKKEQKKFCSVVTMNDLNNIEISIQKLRVYSAYRESALFEAESELIIGLMTQIRDAEKATFYNFF